jgi:hypothetical protein
MTSDDLLAGTAPAVQTLGSAYYFVPETLARGNDLGLDGFRFYFLGRGGVLGDVEASVVASAFGYFEPGLLKTMWDSARQVMPPRDAARAHLECAHSFGRAHFAGVAELAELCAAAEAVVAAAEPAGMALFAGYAAEPLPDDLPARAMQLVAVLRELRGSAHLLAVVASGLSPKVAHYLSRPDAFTLFGWTEGEEPAVSEAERQALAEAERLTDRLLLPAYGVLDGDGRDALAVGIERLAAAI